MGAEVGEWVGIGVWGRMGISVEGGWWEGMERKERNNELITLGLTLVVGACFSVVMVSFLIISLIMYKRGLNAAAGH